MESKRNKVRMKNNNLFPIDREKFWSNIIHHLEEITEIRIRANKPVIVYMNHKELSLDQNGEFIYSIEKGYQFEFKELQKLIDFWCMDSRYAFQEELKKGFLTIKGGHRIGICGEVIYDATGKIQSMKYVSSINIRIAHEIKGIAGSIMKYINTSEKVANTLIISPPGMGKTTLLRDIIRMLSEDKGLHKGRNVTVVDERGEIAACYQGIPQLDIGLRCDVLYGCDKENGMRLLLQSMSPEVIAVDELVTKQEQRLLMQMMGRGCSVIATMHGEGNIENLRYQNWLEGFQIIIFLERDNRSFKTKLYRLEEGKKCKKYWEQYLLLQDS